MDYQPFLKMTVEELLDRWPEAIPVFFQHKMSCVGCSIAHFDTLQDVTATYHLNPQRFVDEVIEATHYTDPSI